MKTKMKVSAHDLLLVNERAAKFIKEFPNGGKLKGMLRPMDQSQIRTLAFVDAVLTLVGGAKHAGYDDVEFEIVTPDSEPAVE